MNTATKTRYLTIAAAMLSMAIGGWAMAQRSDTKSADQSEPTSKGWGAHMDQALMDQLAADGMMQMNKGQIELANFALKHTQNEGVRKFAETSIQNCTNLNNQLQKFAGENTAEHQGDQDRRATGDNSANGDEKKQRDSSTQHESQTAGQPNASNWKALNLDVVRHDVSNQVIASIERELAQYQGADFDRAFTGQQFWGHVTFVAAAKAGEKHVSTDLRKIVEEGTTNAEKQLEECRKLIREVSSNVARNPESSPRR